MPLIHYLDKSYPVEGGESVLKALLRGGCDIPNSCHAGACQSCMMKVTDGVVPVAAQKGVKNTLSRQGYFLACQCHPESDITIELTAESSQRTVATVADKKFVSTDVIRLRLKPDTTFEYMPGQYVTMWRDKILGRSYSLASVPALDEDLLEFHIKTYPNGAMSSWIAEQLNEGNQITLQGPIGDCFYVDDNPGQSLLLAGTGTGAAPLYGIARDALMRGHSGEIHFFHGAYQRDGLYLHQQLVTLSETYPQFQYHGTILEGTKEAMINLEPIDQLIKSTLPELKGFRVYLCGPEDLVAKLRKQTFLSGASMSDIYSDPFINFSANEQIT